MPDEAGDDGGSPPDVTLDSSVPKDASDATLPDSSIKDAGSDVRIDARDEAGCPVGLPGPAMVGISPGAYCIDSTEVTVAMYTDFLAAKEGDTSGQIPKCLWNNSYVPNSWPPPGSTAQAVVGTNWCDAYEYCTWAGKRLCGAIGGGSDTPSDWNNAGVSEWYRACTHDNDGLHVYPYGLNYDGTTCNGVDYGAGTPLVSISTCEGAYPGLFDMSGNVFEWEDACAITDPDASDQSGASDLCNIRGGSFSSDQNSMRCDIGIATGRGNGGGDNGFRCCWD